MRYKADPTDETTWLTLDKIRKLLPPSKWEHDRLLEEVDTAITIGLLPSQFWAASRSDQAFILARTRTTRVMEAYENLLAKKDMNKK